MNTEQKIKEAKEQIQQDILVILESFGIDEAMEGSDYNAMVTAMCESVIANINKINI